MNEPDAHIDLFLTVQRTFAAAPQQLFEAWTTPRAIERWFKPMGWPSKVTALDLRVGGGYCFELTDHDGMTSCISGKYVEIVAPEKLVFTWSSPSTDDRETLVTVEFMEQDEGTQIVLTHRRLLNHEMVSAHQVGWVAVLNLLAEEA